MKSPTLNAMYIPLKNRGLIKIEGPDARDFLQGLISQDIHRVTDGQAVYSAFLSPQGKFLFDFFCFILKGALILDCEGARRSDFFKRLSLYKLRCDVTITDITADFDVFAVLDDAQILGLGKAGVGAAKALSTGIAYVDPRLTSLGCRAILQSDTVATAMESIHLGTFADYERQRINLGLPDGSRDMAVDKALLLENGFEELNGVSFTKGCFMGQELTARTRYRGLVKKRLLPVSIEGATPAPGSLLMSQDRTVGEMKTSLDTVGLALVRLDALSDSAVFTCDDAQLRPIIPDWVIFQNTKET